VTLSSKIIHWFYFCAIAVLVIALPWSKYFMSVAQFMLTGVFIVDGIRKDRVSKFFSDKSLIKQIITFIPLSLFWLGDGIIRKFSQFFKKENLAAIVLSSILLMHFIGLSYTADFDYALNDIRIKTPIFLLPLFFSTMRYLEKYQVRSLLLLFIAAVISATSYSSYLLFTDQFTDIRDISRFISHIRFSLLICIASFILIYFILKRNYLKTGSKIISALGLIWLVVYLLLASSITGLVILFSTAVILVITMFFQQKRSIYLKSAIAAGLLVIPVIIIFYLASIVKDVYRIQPVDFNNLAKETPKGNLYWHNTESVETENGYYVWIYVAPDEELAEAWNKRSALDYYGTDHKGQEIKYTLIRFLTSRGYLKDADGVGKLSKEDVRFIEDGNASIVYCERPGLYVRIYKIIWEYQRYKNSGNASGHSAMQRLEYWKTSIDIIKENFMIGVGTGDMNLAFRDQYEKNNTLLESKYRWRSHNQFLAIFVGFGIIGLLWFIFSLIYPPFKTRKFKDYFYLSFFIIIILSMLWEDTIESQSGVTIYAFFSSFYLFLKKNPDAL